MAPRAETEREVGAEVLVMQCNIVSHTQQGETHNRWRKCMLMPFGKLIWVTGAWYKAWEVQ